MSQTVIASPPNSWWSRVMGVVTRIIGAPDYDQYVKHMSKHHPECALLSKKDFVNERLNDRYSKPGSRCC